MTVNCSVRAPYIASAFHNCVSSESQSLRRAGVDYDCDDLPSSLLHERRGIATRLDAVLVAAQLVPGREGVPNG